MQKSFFFWFWALIICINMPTAQAGGIESRPLEEFSFFQWGALHGLDTQTGGWDIHLGGQLALDAAFAQIRCRSKQHGV